MSKIIVIGGQTQALSPTPTVNFETSKIPVGLLSRSQKMLQIERLIVAHYRRYIEISQTKRNWNPHSSFDWLKLNPNHSDVLMRIILGFFAVEQYVPDFVSSLLRIIRQSHGRSHFHLRWGAEEEKHADLWYLVLLFSKRYKPQWLREYMEELRSMTWEIPFENPIMMVIYTIIQELATKENYTNLSRVLRGKLFRPYFAEDQDTMLAQAANTIAADEAAHYSFFMELGHIFLYHFPAETLEAIAYVFKNFAMPAGNLIPNYTQFEEDVYQAGIYGPREYSRVLTTALKHLGVNDRKAMINGIKLTRRVPNEDGELVDSTFFKDEVDEEGNFRFPISIPGFDFSTVKERFKRDVQKSIDYEKSFGLDTVDPINLQLNYAN